MSSTSVISAILPGTVPKAADVQSIPKADQPVKLSMYSLNAKKSHDPDVPSSWIAEGYLYHGTKTVAAQLDTTKSPPAFVGGVLFLCAYYTPIIDGNMGHQVDISHTLNTNTLGDNSTQWVKARAPLSDWSLNVVEDQNGTLTGTMEKSDGSHWDLKGSFQGLVDDQTTTVSILPATVPEPKNSNGATGQELSKMTAIAVVSDETVQAGMDGAQIRGNAIMQSLILNSLVGTEAEQYIGKMEPITDPDQLAVYELGPDYFPRAGVHMACDFIKKNTTGRVPSSITDHIEWKSGIFNKMCAEPPLPTSQTTSATISIYDPIKQYGLDLNDPEDSSLLTRLHAQFREISMRCYALGYKAQCSQWENYLEDAEGWFNWYAFYCTTPEFLERQAIMAANPPGVSSAGGGADSVGPSSTREVVNKLTLLKFHAEQKYADKKARPKMSIQNVVAQMDAANNQNMAYSMYVDAEVFTNLQTLLAGNTASDATMDQALQQEIAKMDQSTADGAKELWTIAANTGYFLLPGASDCGNKLAKLWRNRNPPGSAKKGMTFGQAIKGLEMVSLSPPPAVAAGAVAPLIAGVGPEAEEVNRVAPGFLKKIGNWVGKNKATIMEGLKLGAHIAAIYGLYYIISGVGGKMSPVDLAITVTTFAVAGLSAAGKLVNVAGDIGRAMNWGFTESKVFMAVRDWFSDVIKPSFVEPSTFTKAAKAFVGDFGKVARVLGLIGCVCSLVDAFDAMSTSGLTDEEKRINEANFALGIVDGVAVVADTFAEIAGFDAIAAACGPIGLIAGLASLVLTVIDIFKSPPDQFADLESWLLGDPKSFKSYDPAVTVTGPAVISIALEPFVGTVTQLPQNNPASAASSTSSPSSPSTPVPGTADGSSTAAVPLMTQAQTTSMETLISTLDDLSSKATTYQSNYPIAQPVQTYMSALSSCAAQGNPFEKAARHFTEATNTFCAQVQSLQSQSLWCVMVLNVNSAVVQQQTTDFSVEMNSVNNSYQNLVQSMAIGGSA